MKKKVLSIFLALMLCLSLLPTAALAEEAGTAGAGDTLAAEQGEGNTVAEQDKDSTGTGQGEGNVLSEQSVSAAAFSSAAGTHSHANNAVFAQKLSQNEDGTLQMGDGVWEQTDGTYVLPEGNYYLESNLTLDAGITVYDEVTLCLNGKSIEFTGNHTCILVHGTFTLTDCKETGTITHSAGQDGNGVFVAGGAFHMKGGSITGNNATNGGGVYVADHATVTIGGGSITNNNADTEGGGMTVEKCQVTLSGKVTITDNKSSTDGTNSNLYIDKSKGGKIVVLNDSLDSNSQVVFKDCDNQYDGTYYISNADTLDNTKLRCFNTDAGEQFVRAKDNNVYVATVLKDKPTAQNLVYNGEEQTGVNVPNGADTYYTITGTRKATQANAAYAQDSENYSGYTAVVKLDSGYALYDRDTRTYYVADTPLNLVWRAKGSGCQ